MGMSLGGYTVSLLGTLLPSLAFLAPIIPLASFADVAMAAGRLVGSPEQQALQQQALENAHRIASPFSRPPRVPADSTVVIAGEGDRITPLSHAEKLRDHFNARYVTFAGGHILQLGRADGFRAVGNVLREKGLFR
jgi:pimeloyl-ACP methyl ester carboxylesterase